MKERLIAPTKKEGFNDISYIINLNDDFYEYLSNFFKEEGIELSLNNTGSILWSTTGFVDD